MNKERIYRINKKNECFSVATPFQSGNNMHNFNMKMNHSPWKRVSNAANVKWPQQLSHSGRGRASFCSLYPAWGKSRGSELEGNVIFLFLGIVKIRGNIQTPSISFIILERKRVHLGELRQRDLAHVVVVIECPNKGGNALSWRSLVVEGDCYSPCRREPWDKHELWVNQLLSSHLFKMKNKKMI